MTVEQKSPLKSLSLSHPRTLLLKDVLMVANILARKQQPVHRYSHMFSNITTGVWPGKYSAEPHLVSSTWAMSNPAKRAVKSRTYQDTGGDMGVSKLLIIKWSYGLSSRIKVQTHGCPKVNKFPSLLHNLVLSCCKRCEIMVLTDLSSPQTRCVDLP